MPTVRSLRIDLGDARDWYEGDEFGPDYYDVSKGDSSGIDSVIIDLSVIVLEGCDDNGYGFRLQQSLLHSTEACQEPRWVARFANTPFLPEPPHPVPIYTRICIGCAWSSRTAHSQKCCTTPLLGASRSMPRPSTGVCTKILCRSHIRTFCASRLNQLVASTPLLVQTAGPCQICQIYVISSYHRRHSLVHTHRMATSTTA